MNEIIDGFGDANIDGRGGGRPTEVTLQDGDQEYWVAPALKSGLETGEFAQYQGKHWGYDRPQRKDQTKTFPATFKCIRVRDFDSKMITTECAECAKNDAIEQKRKDAEAQYRLEKKEDGSAKYTDDQIKEAVKPLSGYLRTHNCDRKWFLNAVDPSGKIVVLKLSNETYKKLLVVAKDARDNRGFKITSPVGGAWIKFSRTGIKPNVSDTVVFATETVQLPDGQGTADKIKRTAFSIEKQKEILAKAVDLKNYLDVLTAEQIRLLVDSGNDPKVVEKIWAMGAPRKEHAFPEPTPPASSPSAPAASGPPVIGLDAIPAAPATQASGTTTGAPIASTQTIPPPRAASPSFDSITKQPLDKFLSQFKLPANLTAPAGATPTIS